MPDTLSNSVLSDETCADQRSVIIDIEGVEIKYVLLTEVDWYIGNVMTWSFKFSIDQEVHVFLCLPKIIIINHF